MEQLVQVAGGDVLGRRDLRRAELAGTTIMWVEHVLRVLTQVATRLVCLPDGRVVVDGTPDEVLNSDVVRTAYLGGSVL
jgi:branched-chain amino acid transport system ATP-binding protein